jgi:hypothetical protein
VLPLSPTATGSGKYPTELVDGVRGSEREAEVQKPRRSPVSGRSVTAARPLEHPQANATEIEHTAGKTVAKVPRDRQDHPSEPAVEVTQGLELVRRQRDVLDLGDTVSEFTTHRFSSRATRSPRLQPVNDWPWYMATPFRPGSRTTTPSTSRMPGEKSREIQLRANG